MGITACPKRVLQEYSKNSMVVIHDLFFNQNCLITDLSQCRHHIEFNMEKNKAEGCALYKRSCHFQKLKNLMELSSTESLLERYFII